MKPKIMEIDEQVKVINSKVSNVSIIKEGKYTATTITNTFIVPEDIFSPIKDTLILSYKGVKLEKDVNYSLIGTEVTLGFNLQIGEIIEYQINKSTTIQSEDLYDGGLLENDTVNSYKLTQEVRDKINKIPEFETQLADSLNKRIRQLRYFKNNKEKKAIDVFYDDFHNYPNGNIEGHSIYKRLNGTAIIENKALKITCGDFLVYYKNLVLDNVFSEGKIRILVDKTDSNFMLNFKHNFTNVLNDTRYSVWSFMGNISFGILNASNVAVKATTPTPTTEDFYVEISCPTLYTGAVVEVRVWGISQPYPSTPTMSYTLTASDPIYNDGYITLQTPGTNKTAIINEILINYGIKPNLNNVTYNGRWFKRLINGEETMCTINQGSEIYANVEGTANVIANFLNISSLNNDPYIAVSIDGGAYVRYKIASSVTIASGITKDKHTIRIVVSGIRETDNVWLQGQGLIFTGLTIDTNGVINPYDLVGKRVMGIGDSITAGVNVLGTGANPTVNSGENVWLHVCCDMLKAIPIQVGFGATGLNRTGSGGVPDVRTFLNYIMNTKIDTQSVDVVVVNVGTNNSADDDTSFSVAYQDLINKIKIKFPTTPIFCINPLTNHAHAIQIQEIAQNTSDCYYVDTTTWGITTTDGIHPNKNGHLQAGINLHNEIIDILGQEFFN